MKEVYRSFEGNLTADSPSGLIVYQGNGFYQVEEIALGKPTSRFRVKEALDWEDPYKVGQAEVGVNDGVVDGQAYCKGRWYSTELIRQIQKDRRDYNWRKYI